MKISAVNSLVILASLVALGPSQFSPLALGAEAAGPMGQSPKVKEACEEIETPKISTTRNSGLALSDEEVRRNNRKVTGLKARVVAINAVAASAAKGEELDTKKIKRLKTSLVHSRSCDSYQKTEIGSRSPSLEGICKALKKLKSCFETFEKAKQPDKNAGAPSV